MSKEQVLRAVLFADLGESGQLYDELGDIRARRITAKGVGLIMEAVKSTGGTVIKTIGDEVMCSFLTPDAAIAASRQIFSDLEEKFFQEVPTPLGAHIGFHYGPVLIENGDLFGDTVNLAARMVSLAKNGEALTTAQTVDRLSDENQVLTRRVDRRSLKGKQGAFEIFEVLSKDAQNLTAVDEEGMESAFFRHAWMVIHAPDATYELDSDHPRLTLGREAENDIILAHLRASRKHARLEHRKGRFYLLDESTNGTVVLIEGDPPVFVRRDEIMLRGRGEFGVSQYPDPDPLHPVRFEIRFDEK